MPMVARGCDLWLTAPCVGTIPAAKERSEVASDTAQAAKTSGPGQRSLKQQVILRLKHDSSELQQDRNLQAP
jgi:hypothetical protein